MENKENLEGIQACLSISRCSQSGAASTEFKSRYDSHKAAALVLYSVGVHTDTELEAMIDRMEYSQLRTSNLTKNDLVKDHLRHLMGGRSNVENEQLYRFTFSERPGTLMKFLDAFSFFHFQNRPRI